MSDHSAHILEVSHLTKTFSAGRKSKPHVAVNDISFYVDKGETLGLVGESGCGKTTTGRTIIRLYAPTSGEIWFQGSRIDGKLNAEETRQVTSNMQMIFQDPVASLNPRMTVEEIICEGAKINRLYSTKDEYRTQMYKMLDMVGLTREHATRYPHEFSGGQRQRICIARALMTQPSFIIADEPISALDVSIQAQVLNILSDLRRELGLTILFIAHDLSVVKYFSNRVAVMSEGRIVEMADSATIYSQPVHDYTRSLLSAIPIPHPRMEKKRKRILYDKELHRYGENDHPAMREVGPGHFVMMSDQEWATWKKT